MRTKLKRLKRPTPSPTSGTSIPQKTWAERHAPLATIIAAYSTLLAVIIAGLGYYYTVIPLYQKAAVDELIAKREVELKEAQAAIAVAKREAYVQQRANFIRAIEWSAVDCSDIRTAIMQPPDTMDEADRLADRERRIRLDLEVSPCLQSVLEKFNVERVLNKTDSRHIGLLFKRIGVELDQKRGDTFTRITNIPSLAARDTSVLAPVGPHVKRFQDSQVEWRKQLADIGINLPEDDPEERLRGRIEFTQEQIAREYRSSASISIRDAVRGIQWPKEDGLISANP